MKECVKARDNGVEAFSTICPYTGLTVVARPEWTDILFGSDYSLSLTFIGDRILSVRIKGYSTRDVVEESTDFTKSIITQLFGNDKEFFYIGDFSGVTGITKDARDYYVSYLKNFKQIKSFILCSPSPYMMLAANLSKKFNISPFPVEIEKDYPAAVKQAAWMACHYPTVPMGKATSSNPPPHVKNDGFIKQMTSAFLFLGGRKRKPVALKRETRSEWHREFDGYSVHFECINDNIIHKVSTGYLSADHVKPVCEIQDQMIKDCGLNGRPYYLVNGAEHLSGSSLKTRKNYARQFSEWIAKYPELRLFIVYGANRLLRASFNISMFTRPVSIIFADDYHEAMAIIQRDKENKPYDRPGFLSWKKRRKNTVSRYAEELNSFLGDINWEVEGTRALMEQKGDDHPFKSVYDAIALIKSDIDELFREREQAQVALRESEEVSRALLNATRDLSLLVQSDCTIISANEPFAAFLGKDSDSLKGKQLSDFFSPEILNLNVSHFKGVIETGEPALFETHPNSRYYENTIYPVFNGEKKVDRLALYARDITGLKQAHEQIHGLTQELIKAQENERKRIARDLHDNVAQDLASLIISSDSLFEGCPEISPEVTQRTRKFSEVLKKTIASIRDLVYDLRPPGLSQIGLVKTIDQYCIDFSKKHNIEIDLYTAGLERLYLDTDTKINIFRILQEALNNANKHAQADLITVRLLSSHPHLILRIEDNGCGFDPEERMMTALKEKRMGIKSMEERVNLLSGELTLRSRKGAGTRIVVKFPYQRPEPETDLDEAQGMS